MNGDEEKIMAKIAEWWDEPAEQEEVWEDVNKKAVKKKHERGGPGGFRGGGGGGGRNAEGRGRGRGRATAGGRGGRGRGSPPEKKEGKEASPTDGGEVEEKPAAPPAAPAQPGVPSPVANAPALKGAWGARAAAVAPAPPAPAQEAPRKAPQAKVEEPAPVAPEKNPLDVGIPAQRDPMPSGRPAREAKPQPVVRAAAPAGGNVWATKGSAHLIQAEKPKPPPAPVAPPAPAPMAPEVVQESDPVPTQAVLEPTLKSGLPTNVTEGGAWGKAASSKPESVAVSVEMPSAPPAMPLNVPPPVEESVAVAPEPKSMPPPAPPAAPTNVLNMGHWDSGDAGDSQNLDFGFGSFGADADAGADKNVGASPAPQKGDKNASTVSPARPPPGLSLGGMPPMPESAVMVHELENKMESASLNAQKKDEGKPITSSLPQPMPAQANHAPVLPGAGVAQQSYNQYGMPGMYNYNAAGSGFVGMTQGGPVLAGVPGQPGKPQGGGINQPGATAGLPQQGLYGSQVPSAPSTGVPDGNNDSSTPGPTGAGIPPGMPGAIPYANPALAHYGQPQYYMGQHQGGIGYNYGYGQFGGVAQGGFGYQPVMGQNQGYGAPHYDDHSQQNSHQSGGSGGYHKNSGGYRGRNNHHNNNQYQNQYNPQHGGYGGQPYGMGYHADHFNQRGGYGPGGMGDPYGMQQGMHAGGFQEDDHQKGKKGGRGNNSSLQQFQQGPPHQLGGQQNFGLQGQTAEAPSSGGAGGWSNNQTGGWSAGAPTWQGGN